MDAMTITRPARCFALLAAGLGLSACVETTDVASSPTSAGPQRIAYQSGVPLAVGESAIVHGRRGDCGSLPSEAGLARSKADLDAQTSLGTFSFGAPGVRRSVACNGDTPARQAIFTATSTGRQTLDVHGDPVSVTVR